MISAAARRTWGPTSAITRCGNRTVGPETDRPATARHFRIAEGIRRAIAAWGMTLVAHSLDLYSDTVSAIHVPPGFDSNTLTGHAYHTYGVSCGVGLGPLDGKVFRIGHLGSMTDVMALSGVATLEMAMADLGYPITLGAGVAAAQDHYRATATIPKQKAA